MVWIFNHRQFCKFLCHVSFCHDVKRVEHFSFAKVVNKSKVKHLVISENEKRQRKAKTKNDNELTH